MLQRRLSVYNLVSNKVAAFSDDVSKHCLPRGTVLAIKEPYFRVGSADSQPFLRVDSPMDLMVISDPRHPLVVGTAWEEDVRAAAAAAVARGGGASPQSLQLTAGATAADVDQAAQWQSQGNALFGSGHFVDALHAYHQGLVALQQAGQAQLASEQQAALAKRTAVLLNNSAAACLGFGAHESARAYAQLALRGDPGNPKALMRLAKALDGLGRWGLEGSVKLRVI